MEATIGRLKVFSQQRTVVIQCQMALGNMKQVQMIADGKQSSFFYVYKRISRHNLSTSDPSRPVQRVIGYRQLA